MGDALRLFGLKALVTSGGGGIGEAVSRTLAKHGATVLAVDTINSGVEQQFASVKGIDGRSASFMSAKHMPALIEEAVDHLGGLDILINDFPERAGPPISDGNKRADKLLEARAVLITAICRAALPYLKKSPQGRIINLGFLRSVFAADGAVAFAKSTQNLAAMTRTLGTQNGEFGITANYIQPGAIMTPSSREAFRKDMALRDFCIANSAARRLGEPIDVAKVALFLASDDAVFVSGTGVLVDGGSARDQ